MRGYDFSPLFRSSVGFDRLGRLVDAAMQQTGDLGYPPYNIEAFSEDSYLVTMAVAGFGPEDIEIVATDNLLTVKGKAAEDEPKGTVLHRGIARRAFERQFNLADHIKVTSASLVNGLLEIGLVREVPESLKPRRIEIATAPRPATIEQKAA